MSTTATNGANSRTQVSNEYVLNVAFLSFLAFTTLQLFFAVLARSQSMMADCAAMYVDVVTYMFNFIAERLKHHNRATCTNHHQQQMRQLFFELVPPLLSVTTLVAVTILSLKTAFMTLSNKAYSTNNSLLDQPNVGIMLVFSALNLLLDFLNVSCFARVDQAVGLSTTAVVTAYNNDNDDLENHHSCHDDECCHGESQPLIQSSERSTSALNLNMCSAFTHICADTMRSVAVLVAAGFAYIFPDLLSAADADSWGAVVVSVIILISLAPLIQGLYWTSRKVVKLWDK